MKKLAILLACSLMGYSFIVEAANRIRFGVNYFYPPFVFSSKSGYIHGFDVDVAKAVCKQLNAECTFTAMSLSDLFASLDNNKSDAIMGAISVTPARKQHYDFTRPYLKSTMSYVSLRNANVDLNHLEGKRVGAVKDSTFQTYLNAKYGHNIKLITFDTNEALANALSNKLIEIILLDSPAATYWVNYSTGLFKIVGTPTYLSFDEGYGIVVKKGNVQLQNALNNALTTIIQNGTFDKIKQSYFAHPTPLESQTTQPSANSQPLKSRAIDMP